MTLDRLADRLITKMVINEVVSVAIVALSMFVIWSGPGGQWGTVFAVIAGVIAIARVWTLPGRELTQVPMESATDPNAAAAEMTDLANKTMLLLQIPTAVGFLASIMSGGWQPVVVGSLITIAGFTFFGPSRTRLASWRDRMENGGGKTGL